MADQTQIEQWFNEAWEHYPRKEARKDALRCFTARHNQGVQIQDLIDATVNYADECKREGRPRKYTLLGATFYGPNERWRAYLLDAPGPVEEGVEAEIDIWTRDALNSPAMDDANRRWSGQ